jgi:tetratricopeptide (TPR) repeat protein
MRIGDVLLKQRRLKESLASYREGLDIIVRLAGADNSLQTKLAAAAAYRAIGNALLTQAKLSRTLTTYRGLDEARMVFNYGLAILEPLTRLDERVEWQWDLSRLYENTGDLFATKGDFNIALDNYRTVLDIRERVAATDRSNAQWQHDLLLVLHKIGDAFVWQGQLEEALAPYRQGVAIAEQLANLDPGSKRQQRDLAVCHGKVATVYERQGRSADALVEFNAGRDIVAALAALMPEHAQWKNDLAWFDRAIARLKAQMQQAGPK